MNKEFFFYENLLLFPRDYSLHIQNGHRTIIRHRGSKTPYCIQKCNRVVRAEQIICIFLFFSLSNKAYINV